MRKFVGMSFMYNKSVDSPGKIAYSCALTVLFQEMAYDWNLKIFQSVSKTESFSTFAIIKLLAELFSYQIACSYLLFHRSKNMKFSEKLLQSLKMRSSFLCLTEHCHWLIPQVFFWFSISHHNVIKRPSLFSHHIAWRNSFFKRNVLM